MAEAATEDKKRKLEAAAEDGPAAKEPRAEVEPEKDAVDDARPRLSAPVAIDPSEMTLNVLPTHGGNLLMALSDCGMHYLVAGARANVGMRAGRYMYEARIVEALGSSAASGAKGPKQTVRIGFSAAGSSLFLGETEDGVSFDADGLFIATREKGFSPSRTTVTQKFGKGEVMGVLLNLEDPQAGTISLFRNGVRACPPQPIPEALRGKALFPHVLFRSVSLHLHFGAPSCRLPFSCRAIQDAALADVEVTPSSLPKDGKYSVVFPVSLPDEGTFDWLDGFLERNPQYVELSDRKLLDWAAKSGLWRSSKAASAKHSNDRPDINFGIPVLDDLSARKLLQSVASLVPRNYVVMEVKSNLLKDERSELASKFRKSQFKRIARVTVGEPDAAHVERVLAKILAEKQAALDSEFQAKKTQMEVRRKVEQRRKELLLEAKKKKKVVLPDGETKEPAEEEAEEDDDEAKVEEKAEDAMDIEAEKAELTAEERKRKFSMSIFWDVSPAVLSGTFGRFSMPSQDEPFDDIVFEWSPKDKAEGRLKEWAAERKVTLRLEELEPGEWFRNRVKDWEKVILEWTAKQKSFKLSPAFREKTAAKEAGNEEDKEAKEVDEDVDLLAVEDITMTANGEPLFQHFGQEDWALAQLRFELYSMAHAYQKDVDDDGYPGIHESNLAFYYNKYYTKTLNTKSFGANSSEELVALVKDTVKLPSASRLLTICDNKHLSEESLDVFIKLTEEGRRERQRRLDAGDESAKLKFNFAELVVGIGGVPGLRALRQNLMLKNSWKVGAGQAMAGWQRPAVQKPGQW